MRKIILLLIVGFTTLMAIEFTMTESGLYPYTETQSLTTSPSSDNWVETPLPTKAFNVLDYGLKGDGKTDDSAALKNLAKNTSITNWYFPAGKTFLLSRVDVPSHVVALYGGGKIISKGYTGATNPDGAFNINNFSQNTATNLVIDGLVFERGSGFDGGEAYGQITVFQYGGSTNGIEIRNCSFDSKNFKACCIKGFAESDGSMTHNGMRIYNNNFTNIQAIAVELFDKQTVDTATGFTNTYVYNNTFTDGSGMAISMAGIRQNFYVYDNRFTNIGWAIETAECDNGFVYNNYGVGLKTYSFVDSIKWGGPFVSPGVIKVHHNHFEGSATFMLYNGGPTEVYENYIRGPLFIKIDDFGDGPTNTVMGNVHDNTFVLDYSHQWTTRPINISDMQMGRFYNNDIYNTNSGKPGVQSTNSNNVVMYDNKIYTNGGVCISGDTQTGGSCNTNYTNIPPRTR